MQDAFAQLFSSFVQCVITDIEFIWTLNKSLYFFYLLYSSTDIIIFFVSCFVWKHISLLYLSYAEMNKKVKVENY